MAAISERAVRLFEQTLALRKAKYGPNNPSTLFAMQFLAIAYNGDNEASRQYRSSRKR